MGKDMETTVHLAVIWEGRAWGRDDGHDDPPAMEAERAGLAARDCRRAPARMSATGLSAPALPCSETVGADGAFHFDVPMTLPLIGVIVHYTRNLKPIEMSGESSDQPS